MPRSANVKSVQAIANFRAALIKFSRDVTNGVTAQKLELNRAVDWLSNDRPAHWQQKAQEGWTEVAERRADLERCQMRRVAGQRPGCQEEKDALDKAKRDVRHAEEMIHVVRGWCQTMQHETLEYEGRISALEANCATEVPRAVATLDRIMAALDDYVTTHGPVDDSLGPVEDNPSGDTSGLKGKPLEATPRTSSDRDHGKSSD